MHQQSTSARSLDHLRAVRTRDGPRYCASGAIRACHLTHASRPSLPAGHRKSIEGGESIRARTAPAGFQLIPVTGNNHFSLITFEHNAQPQSDCEHLEFSVSRGPGKLQRLFWQMLLDHGRPMTFAEIRGRARVGYAREGRARRALQGLMNHGVVIATGSGGKGHPYHYSVNPVIPVDITRNGS